ncbi:MAG: nucleotidyltransferase domain-containing protein [Rhodanobacteraceae bacterium]|nr:nucleotidyltransferase domain-containing protein [Rhodanobacteraceae bacterium]
MRALSSKLELAAELKPFEADSAREGWTPGSDRPIVVRGPEAGRFTVVSGVEAYVRNRHNVIVDVVPAADATIDDYGAEERAALARGRPDAQLPEDIDAWLRDLVAHTSEVREIWWFGSRVSGTARPESDWDILIKGPPGLVARMATGLHFHRDDVDLLVCEDNANIAVNPWVDSKSLSINVGWHELTNDYAEYDGTKPVGSESDDDDDDDGRSWDVRRCRAILVWPKACAS